MELLVAAKQGSLAVLKALVSHPSCDLLARDEEGNTALHIAASRGHHDVVLELASRYTAPSGEVYAGVNDKGQTPLHLACCNGWVKCVDHLINELHFDFNVKDVSGNTPLQSASKAGHNNIILLLLQKCKVCINIETKEENNLNQENTGDSSCLLAAAKQGSLGVVRAIVSHPSCDLLARDEEGNTALHIAASRGHHDVVLELASKYNKPSDEACVGVNNEGQTPLHLACYKGWIKCVDPLAIKFPKEINVRDNNGNTPIMAASLAGHKTLVSLLKERYKVTMDSKGKLPKRKEDKHKLKPSDRTKASSCILAAAKQGSLGVVRALVSHPSCDLLARDEEGNTALHIAASRGHHDVVVELASRYTAPSKVACAGVNNEGQTPLHLACYKGWIKCVDPLATKFPKEINVSDNNGNTPIMAASLAGHKTLVSLLKERYKVAMDSKEGELRKERYKVAIDSKGKLPKRKEDKHKLKPSNRTEASSCLLAATKQGSLSVVRALVSHPSCDLLARDEEGNTALHIAASRGHYSVVVELASRYTAPSGKVYAGVNNTGQTPLHLACRSGWVDCTQTLATMFPGDLNVKNEYDNLPLHDAALFGHGNVVDCLCEEFGCDVDSLGDYNRTCLFLASTGGHMKLARSLLVKYGCRRDALDDAGGLASTCAAFYGHTHLLQMLLDEFNFSSTAVTVRNGSNLLHQACGGKHYETTNILINKYNLDPLSKELDGSSALHCLFYDTFEKIGDFHTPADVEITTFVDHLISLKCDPISKDNMGRNALHYAAFSGQTEVVIQLVTKYKCLVESRDNNENTPLHYAAGKGHVHVVEALLSDLAADVEARDKQNDTALHVAALNGHRNVVTLLIDQFGCNPHIKGFNNMTPLHQACHGGHVELVEKLINDYHCDPMARDDKGVTPLHMAALAGKEDVVKRLISNYDSSVQCRDNNDNTPLHCGAGKGHVHVVEALLSDLAADVEVRDKQNDTALHVAALNGHSNVVTILIDQFGCSPHTKGFNNMTPLHHACGGGNLELIEKLINDYHCDPMARDDKGVTPLHMAALSGKEDVVKRLVSNYDYCVQCRDNDDNTPLHCAARGGHVHVVQALLSDLTADVEARNKQNDTALNVAALNGHSNVVSLLIDHFGCSARTKGFNNRTILHHACAGGHLELVEKLINDYHCDPIARDNKGLTPLLISISSKNKSIVTTLLLKYNCSPHICDADGNTALHGYVSQGDKDMVEMLVDLIGIFPSIKNNDGKTPIDLNLLVLLLMPNVRTCVEYLSKHAVGEYRHSPQKVLVFDKEVVSSLSSYSSYSLLSSPFTQSCGLCYMKDLVGTDIWVCHAAPDTQHTSVLQTLLSGPIIMAVITVSLNISTNDAVNKVLSQVSLTKQLAKQDTVPLKVLLTASSSFDQQSLFNGICMDVIEKVNMDTSIHFSQQFLICQPEKYERRLHPVLSKFICDSVSTIRNPDIPEITHGSIYLLKYLYRENHGKLYVKFSDLSKQLQSDRIMEEGHPELVQSSLRQLDEQGYVITTGTVDDPQYIVLNPLHVLQTMDQFSHNVSDPHVHAGLYSRKLLSSLPCVEPLMLKLYLSLPVPSSLVNLVMKENVEKHVKDQFYFSPQFATCHRQVNNWTCQPGEVFSCGLCINPVGQEHTSFPSQLISTILLKAMKYFTDTFVMAPYPPLDCTLWKGGMQWMANNVEVLLEVRGNGSSILMMGRSDVSKQLQCMDMFVKVVDMVLDVKSDNCGGIQHMVKVLDPNALESQSIPPANNLLWCDASSAINALRIGKRHVQSTCKSKHFPVKKLDWLHRFSLQDKLFPMEYKIVSGFLEGVTVRWEDIARELGLSEQTIDRINNAHQGNPEFCCKQMIEECLIGKEVKMNWHSLAEALRKLHMEDLVDMICEYWGHHVRVQTMLHDDKLTFTRIDATAQQQLAVIVEPHWKHLAPYISPSASTGPGNVEPVIDHLQDWMERMHPTFGDLSEILSHLYIQPPLPIDVQLSVKSPPSRDPDDHPCHHSCPESLSEMCSTTVHSEKVDIAGKTIECEELGFSIAFPPGAVISPVTVSVCCSFKREFSPPEGYQFVSPVYILHVHPETQFLKKVTLSLQHWAKSDGSDLRFTSCPFPNDYHSYPFEVKDRGDFTSHSRYGRIEVDHFSLEAVIRVISNTFSWMSSFLSGSGGGEHQVPEEAGPSMPHPVLDETQNEENCYRASLVWPLKTKISDVTEWLYAVLLSLDHNAVLTNMVKWMKTEFPNFIWTYDAQSVELHPKAEAFIVEPEAVDQDITIIGNNTISRKDIDRSCNDLPPRIFLEAKAGNFTSCSVTIKNVVGCKFVLTAPSGVQAAGTCSDASAKVLNVTSQELGINDLLIVLEEIKDVNNKWKFLGLALGLKKPTLDGIKSNDYDECKMEMIEKWLNKVAPDCNPSWSSLVAALRSPLVQHSPSAQAIENKYLHS